MVLFTGLDTHSTYTAHVLPGLLVLGVGWVPLVVHNGPYSDSPTTSRAACSS
jgi:hypothetical protein